MSALRLLVVEGNVKAARERAVASGGSVASTHYAALLQSLAPPGARVDVCFPADPGANLPDAAGLSGYDGIAITGSALNIYDGGPAITAQITLAQEIFKSGTPCFGSCWGLQLASVAAGGTVAKNPRGREIGFARRITLTEAGRAHPMYAGKDAVFDAIAVHLDEVTVPPPGLTLLAANDWSPVQAASWTSAEGTVFWGVQYHPEYSFAEIAAVFRRYDTALIQQGIFRDLGAKAAFEDELMALDRDPHDSALTWKYGLGPSVTDAALRTLELSNFIRRLVLPVKSARGRA